MFKKNKIKNLLDWNILSAIFNATLSGGLGWAMGGAIGTLLALSLGGVLCVSLLHLNNFRTLKKYKPTPLGQKSELTIATDKWIEDEVNNISKEFGVKPPIIIRAGNEYMATNKFLIMPGPEASSENLNPDFLFQIGRKDVLSSIIAHEMSHIKSQDSLYRLWSLCSQAGWGVIGIAMMMNYASGTKEFKDHTLVTLGVSAFNILINRNFDLKKELRADSDAIEHGYAEGLLRYLRLEQRVYRCKSIISELLDPHPSDSHRLFHAYNVVKKVDNKAERHAL